MIRRILAAFALTTATLAQTPPLRPTEYRTHFAPNPGAYADSGSRDGWESFPISQETGYDPTISPETRNGESFLVREAAPTRDGRFELGFIRRLNLVTGPAASMTVRVRAPRTKGPARITVSLFRGEQEERHTATLLGACWQQIHFLLAASPRSITAVALAAGFDAAIAGRSERFEIADLRLRALAIPRLDLLTPAALWDPARELYYLQRALHPGETLTAAAKGSLPSAWTLTDPTGHLVAHDQGPIAYRLSRQAAPGVWTLHLVTPQAESTALLLVRPETARGILFDQAPAIPPPLLQSVRERRDLLRKTAFPEGGRNIAQMSPQFLLPGLPSYFNVLLQPTELAMLDAIDFRASADPAALAEARSLLAAIAQWPLWVHPWFPAHGYHSYYPVGIAAKYVVLAEQFLAADLPPPTRQALDRSLIDHVVQPVYEEYVHEDRLQFNTSNWIGNTVGGALLAALASEDPEAPGYLLGLYTKQHDHVLASYTPDGSYGEGVTYHRFDLEMTTLVAEAARRLLGQSLDAALLGGERYMQHAAYGKDGLLDFGDSHVDLTPSNAFAYLAAQNRSDNLSRFYFQYRDTGTAELISRVLWESEIHPPAAIPEPPEPPSKLFPDRGIVVLRDTWSPQSTVIAMRAGKNFNHNHADQGSLFFAYDGKLWFGEAGYADYYKDPFYPTFNIQAAGHNTLLLDHNPESQQLPGNAVFQKSPTMLHRFVGEDASLVEAGLASVYPSALQTCTRTLFHQPGGPLFVVDRVNAQSPHVVTQLWHPAQHVASLDPSRNRLALASGGDQVQLRAFSSVPIQTVQRDSPLPLTAYEQAEHRTLERPTHLEISTVSAERETIIVTLIASNTDLAEASTRQTREAFTVSLGSSGVKIGQGADHAMLAWWPEGAILLHGRLLDTASGSTIASHDAVDLKLSQRSADTFSLEVVSPVATTLTLNRFVAIDSSGLQRGETVHVAAGSSVILLRR